MFLKIDYGSPSVWSYRKSWKLMKTVAWSDSTLLKYLKSFTETCYFTFSAEFPGLLGKKLPMSSGLRQDWKNLHLGNPYGQITEFHLLLSPWIVEINTSWWSKISINLLHVLSTFQQKKSEGELLICMRWMTLSFVPSI